MAVDFSSLITAVKTDMLQVGKRYDRLIGRRLAWRPVEAAVKILEFLAVLQNDLQKFFTEHPSLGSVFDHDFEQRDKFFTEEYVLRAAYYLPGLFSRRPKDYVLSFSAAELDEQLTAYGRALQQWREQAIINHAQMTEILARPLVFPPEANRLLCTCASCAGQWQQQVYEHLAQVLQEKIAYGIKHIQEAINEPQRPAEIYSAMKGEIDRIFGQLRGQFGARYFLARTERRLEQDYKRLITQEFCYPAPMAKVYISQNLKPRLTPLLEQQGVDPHLISPEQYERFWAKLKLKLWQGEHVLNREFKNFILSALAFKRHDISATILNAYLGEFWQQMPVRKKHRRIIYHKGPTNSGKTYHAMEALRAAKTGCYLAPLRLLAAEIYDTMNSKGTPTTLLTGEEVIEVPQATHISSTVEMAKIHEIYDCCVIDEIQMITDPQRGWAWTRALLGMDAPEVHVCGDSSVDELLQKIAILCGDSLEVKTYERMAAQVLEDHPVVLNELQRSDALIAFSRRNVLKYKILLENAGFKVSVVYGRLGPEVRREQARKFDRGETDVIVATDAIAMGMNLPIRRIVFSTLTKFVDLRENDISPSEIKQIAGRCGRYKRFPTGYVTCLKAVTNGLKKIKQALQMDLPQKAYCMVGPDLEIFAQVNQALTNHKLKALTLPEFLRLFNTVSFTSPFLGVDLTDMLELAEMAQHADATFHSLTDAELFGFACAPVNLGLPDHVQYFNDILRRYAAQKDINFVPVDYTSDNIDYLETAIKCVELYQWLARHFNGKHFVFVPEELADNKAKAIEKLNQLLSNKIVPTCSSCGRKLPENSEFPICEECFQRRRFRRSRPPRRPRSSASARGPAGRRSSRAAPSSPAAPHASRGNHRQRYRQRRRRH
ncbi:MAG: hypothetical protein J6Y94_02905 [Bacteriovoracaceae bacterium]|nr:hypothetical protein [Bacteriovoracaceae bacterium]